MRRRGRTCPSHWLELENVMPSLRVNGAEVDYAEAGAGGRPLLMVHGTLSDQRSFSGQMAPSPRRASM